MFASIKDNQRSVLYIGLLMKQTNGCQYEQICCGFHLFLYLFCDETLTIVIKLC